LSLFQDCKGIIQYEDNICKPPVADDAMIRFNGVDDDGHETFVLMRSDVPASYLENKNEVFGFCKTARKPYDKYVTAVLLLAKLYLQDEIRISSDGDIADWKEGQKLIKEKVGMRVEIVPDKDAEHQEIENSVIREKVKELA
jgi:hypothetical protein